MLTPFINDLLIGLLFIGFFFAAILIIAGLDWLNGRINKWLGVE